MSVVIQIPDKLVVPLPPDTMAGGISVSYFLTGLYVAAALIATDTQEEERFWVAMTALLAVFIWPLVVYWSMEWADEYFKESNGDVE